jgi:hypothetical protein
MFHTGARIPGTHPRLEGGGDTSRVLKIASLDEANRARPDIERIVRAWCDWRGGDVADGAAPSKKKRPSPTATRKKAAIKPKGR